MANYINDEVLDVGLNGIAALGDMLYMNTQIPANYADAIGANALNDGHTLTVGDGNGDYTIAAGDTSGRKLTLEAQTAIAIDAAGDITHFSIVDVSETDLLYTGALTATQTVAIGNTVDLAAVDIVEARDLA